MIKCIYKDDRLRGYVMGKTASKRLNPKEAGSVHVILVRWGHAETHPNTRDYLTRCGLDPDRCALMTNDWFGSATTAREEIHRIVAARGQ